MRISRIDMHTALAEDTAANASARTTLSGKIDAG